MRKLIIKIWCLAGSHIGTRGLLYPTLVSLSAGSTTTHQEFHQKLEHSISKSSVLNQYKSEILTLTQSGSPHLYSDILSKEVSLPFQKNLSNLQYVSIMIWDHFLIKRKKNLSAQQGVSYFAGRIIESYALLTKSLI